MKKLLQNSGTLLAPVAPVMVSCGDMENSNIITIAWNGIINTKPPVTYISVRPKRHSYEIIKVSGEFVINLTTSAMIHSADYCGIYTGKKVDKFQKCKFTKEASYNVKCPSIAESPLSMECKVREIIPFGTHDMFIADIVGVSVDDTIIDTNGKIRLDKVKLAAYAHGDYFELGRKIGSFGFLATKRNRVTD